MKIIREASTSVFNKINKILGDMGREYHRDIPLDKIFQLFTDEGITPVQEDMTPWSGMLTGREGRAIIELMEDGKLLKRALTMTWYKMPSGKYEIVAYC